MPTKIKQNEDIQIIDYRYDEGFRGRVESQISSTLTTKSSGFSGQPMIMKQSGGGNSMLKIRKLTPKECMKLMGFTPEDYQALVNCGLSDSAIYHCAGDSIVVPCLISIFSPFVNEQHTHIEIVEKYVEREIIDGQ